MDDPVLVPIKMNVKPTRPVVHPKVISCNLKAL